MRLMIILKLAVRNLFRHKAKTLIIGVIITLGMFILVLGNSVMDSAAAGLKKSFIDNYTGHIMISSKPKDAFERISIMGRSNAYGSTTASTLPKYQEILEHVKSLPEVTAYTSQITGMALLGSEDKKAAFAMLFGIEPESYHKMFDSLNIESGHYLMPNEPGILLSVKTMEALQKVLGEKKVGDTVILHTPMGMGFKIREAVIRGTFTSKVPGSFPTELAYIDAETLRALTGMNVGGADEVKLNKEDQGYAFTSEDDLFSGNLIDTARQPSGNAEINLVARLKEKRAVVPLGDTWSFILLKVKNESDVTPLVTKLNAWFKQQDLDARAQDWLMASGGLAAMADSFKAILNILILIIAVVAVIIIINTLVITIMERTTEIGMMRALGAQKGFIWRLLTAETMLIAISFGLAGIILGCLGIGLLNLIGIRTDNQLLTMVLGGYSFRPGLSLSGILWPLGIMLLIGLLSQFYPSTIAMKIKPIKAIRVD